MQMFTSPTIPGSLDSAHAVGAVDRWLEGRQPVDPDLLEGWGLHLWDAHRRGGAGAAEVLRGNVTAQLAAERTLRLAREALDGPMVLIKGLALAPLWPDAACRPAGDVDVLVPDAAAAWECLRGHGWTPADVPQHPWRPGVMWDPPWHWHAYPLDPPGGGPCIELHRRAAWPLVLDEMGAGIPPAELIARAQAPVGASIPDGVDVPDLVDHALVMAAGSWGKYPFERLSQLVDVHLLALAAGGGDRVRERAAQYGLGRLWDQVWGAAESVFGGEPAPLSFRMLGRWMWRADDPTFVNMTRVAGWFHIAPPHRAAATAAGRVSHKLAKVGGRHG